MARVVQGDDLMFNAMTFGRAAPEFSNFVAQQWDAAKSISSLATNNIMQSVDVMANQIANSNIYRMAEAALNYAGSLWGRDLFQDLQTRAQVQNAPAVMVPYLMACPEVRALHNKGRCESYGELYEDMQVGAIKENHDEWRAVMNGVVNLDTGGDWEATTYSELDDRMHAAPEIDHHHSIQIRNAWLLMTEAVADGVDPTDRMDGDL